MARLANRVEREKVVLVNVVVRAQIVQAREQHLGLRVLVRHAHHDDATSVVVIKVNTLCDFAARDGKKDGPAPTVARLAVVVQRYGRLDDIFRLDKHELALEQLGDHALAIPLCNRALHVGVRGEEADDAVGHDRGQGNEQVAEIAHDAVVVALVKCRADRALVRAAGHDHGEDGFPRVVHGHGERLADRWGEPRSFG